MKDWEVQGCLKCKWADRKEFYPYPRLRRYIRCKKCGDRVSDISLCPVRDRLAKF